MNINSSHFIRFLIVLSVFWAAIVTLFNYRQYSLGYVICGSFILLYFFTHDIEDKFLVLLSGLPFQAITKFAVGTPSISVFLYFAFIVECIYLKRFSIKNKQLVSIFGLLFLQIISALRYDLQLKSVVSTFLVIIFAAYAMELFEKCSEPMKLFEKCAWVYIITMLINIYSVSVFPNLPYYILLNKQLILDRIGRFCALNADPNYYGQLIMVAFGFLAGLAIMYYRNKQKKLGFLCVVLGILFAYNGSRSISKGYIVGFACTALVLVWFIIMENKPVKRKPVYFLLFIAVGVLASYLLINNLVIPTIERRSETDLFTGRLEKWQLYFDMIKNDPLIILLGTGFSNSPSVILNLTGINAAAHNLYLEALCDIGLVGMFFIALLWSGIYKVIKSLFSNSLTLFLWGFLITSISLSASANDVMYFVVPISVLVFSKNLTNDVEDIEYIEENKDIEESEEVVPTDTTGD